MKRSIFSWLLFCDLFLLCSLDCPVRQGEEYMDWFCSTLCLRAVTFFSLRSEAGQRAGTPLPWGKTEGDGFFQDGEGSGELLLWSFSASAYEEDGYKVFSRSSWGRTRGDVLKLKNVQFIWAMRQMFFTKGLVKHWHRWPREMVDVPSLEIFKVRLDMALSNMI